MADPIKREKRAKLLKILQDNDNYDGETVEQMERYFADESRRDELYGHIMELELYSKTKEEFNNNFFSDIITPTTNEPQVKKGQEQLEENKKKSQEIQQEESSQESTTGGTIEERFGSAFKALSNKYLNEASYEGDVDWTNPLAAEVKRQASGLGGTYGSQDFTEEDINAGAMLYPSATHYALAKDFNKSKQEEERKNKEYNTKLSEVKTDYDQKIENVKQLKTSGSIDDKTEKEMIQRLEGKRVEAYKGVQHEDYYKRMLPQQDVPIAAQQFFAKEDKAVKEVQALNESLIKMAEKDEEKKKNDKNSWENIQNTAYEKLQEKLELPDAVTGGRYNKAFLENWLAEAEKSGMSKEEIAQGYNELKA